MSLHALQNQIFSLAGFPPATLLTSSRCTNPSHTIKLTNPGYAHPLSHSKPRPFRTNAFPDSKPWMHYLQHPCPHPISISPMALFSDMTYLSNLQLSIPGQQLATSSLNPNCCALLTTTSNPDLACYFYLFTLQFYSPRAEYLNYLKFP